MKKLTQAYKTIDIEEKANVWTHLAGIIFTTIIGPILLFRADDLATRIGLISFIVGTGFMFVSSTIYHLMHEPDIKKKWQLMDHISIFVLISCSYSAFFAYHYNTVEGYLFLALHWTISIVGIFFKIKTRDKYEIISLSLYVVLGWMVAFVFEEATCNMSSQVFTFLMIGGLGYMIGIIFYLWETLKFNHAIWHIGVNIGVVFHALALYYST